MKRIYFDHNATTALDPLVFEAMKEDLEGPPANPSSTHWFGRRAKNILERSRNGVAKFFDVDPSHVFFTSGGTESLKAMINSRKGGIITSNLEHSAVVKPCSIIPDVTFISPGTYGTVTADLLKSSLKPQHRAVLLSLANNETGVKLDLPSLGKVALENEVPLWLDAVSFVGKEKYFPHESVEAIAISAHKFHGPKGVGALIFKNELSPIAIGGMQENSKRAGTENLSGIIGLAKALELFEQNQDSYISHILKIRTYFETELKTAFPDVEFNGTGPKISNTSNVFFPGCEGESLLLQLDLLGISVSMGSACSSGALEPSRVLLNMGYNRKRANSSLRVSFGRNNTLYEVNYLLENLIPMIKKIRVKD
jgi:cysteine desulfurase